MEAVIESQAESIDGLNHFIYFSFKQPKKDILFFI